MKIKVLIITLLSFHWINCNSQNKIDSLGRKQGLWSLTYLDGNPKETGLYKDDLKVGIWKKFSHRGILIDSISYLHGKKTGRSKHRIDGGDYISNFQFIDYHLDSGLTIWGYWHKVYINEDSTYMSLYKDSTFKYIECTSNRKEGNKMKCVKLHKSGEIYQRKQFENFTDAFINWDTPWKLTK